MIPSFTTYTSFYHHQSWSSSLNLHTALSRRWANCAADATKKYQRYEPHHHQKDGLTLIRHVNLSRGGGEAQKRRIDINAASATVTANSHDYGDEAHSPSSNLTSQTVGVSIHNNIKTNLQVMYIKYKNMIDKRPVLTKSISCGILSCIGDILSQWITFRSLLFVSSSSSAFYWNALQSWTFFITGCVFVGPYIHFWYQCLWILGQKLQNKYPILFSSKIKQMFVLNVLDQTLGVAIFFPMYFYFYEMILAACLWRGMCVLKNIL